MTIGTMTYKGYAGTIECDRENDCLFGSVQCPGADLVMYEGETLAEVRASFRAAVDDYIGLRAAESRKTHRKPAAHKRELVHA